MPTKARIKEWSENMKIPELISYEKSHHHISMVLKMNASLCWFEGHFPNYAILPAIAQIYMAKYFSALFFAQYDQEPSKTLEQLKSATKLNIASLNRMKFVKPIEPDNEVILDLTFNEQKQTIKFSYSDLNGNAFSQGQLKLMSAQ